MTKLRENLLLLVAAVLLVAGVFGWWMSRGADAEVENHALSDEVATLEVSQSVSRAITGVLSYDYSDPARSESIADDVLSGDAREEYDRLLAALQEKAPGQKLVLTARVQAAAVKVLNGDHAELLVFVDQKSQRADDEEASISAAQLQIEAEKVQDAWTITELQPL